MIGALLGGWACSTPSDALPEPAEIERWLLGTNDAHGFYEKLGFTRASAGKYMLRLQAG